MDNVVRIDGVKAEPANALESLSTLLADDLDRVNAAITARMDSPVTLIPQLAGHLIGSGGKRLRPILTLATSKMCGYDGERHIDLSACVEFIHTATLLHDDVVDESGLRRGRETANMVWGNQASVLVGDFLFSRAFQIMTEDGSLKVLKLLSQTSSTMAEGEVLQLMTANNTDTNEDAYLQVVTSKTAALFAAACTIGAVLGDRPTVEEEALASFGRNLGIAFQLIDDALDYSAHQGELGKTIGDDFREGKLTLPIILAFRRCAPEERDFWRRTVEKVDQTDEDLKTAIAMMVRYGTLDDTVARARHYGAMAKDALGIFPASTWHDALDDLVDFCIERAY